jgi:hypothetical protein
LRQECGDFALVISRWKNWVFFFLAVVCCGWFWQALGQDPPKRSGAEQAQSAIGEPPASQAARIEESEPSLFYLKSKEGKLVPVPNFTFEDFERLYKMEKQLAKAEQPPSYVLSQLTIAGSAKPDAAELTATATIQSRKDGWVRVPLRFDRAVLREPADYRGPGEHNLVFEGDGEGYVCWLNGTSGQQHELTLKMLAPVSSSGEETRMKLVLARATFSTLTLQVPLPGAIGRVSSGATLETKSPAGAASTELFAGLPGGEFEIAWRPAAVKASETPVVLDATGEITAKIDNRGVGSEAVLSVRSLGGAFERFRVRLPMGAKLTSGNSARYTVKEIEVSDAAASQRRLVEVELANKTTGPVELRLGARRSFDDAKADPWVDLAGFDIEGAKRQSGTISVGAPGDWQVLWGTCDGARQIDQDPDATRREDVAAVYEYFAQPYALNVRLVPKRTRIAVEPEYQMQVQPDSVELKTTLKYNIGGAKVTALIVALPGWEKIEVTPENLVAIDGITNDADGEYVFPLTRQTSGQVELRIEARQAIPAGAAAIRVKLPQPRADAVAPAGLLVSSADNVELVANDDDLEGLVREEETAQTSDGRAAGETRYRCQSADAVFAADFRVRSRQIHVSENTRLTWDDRGGRVEQTLSYKIAYEPADYLLLDVPRSAMQSNALKIRRGKETISAEQSRADDEPGVADNAVRLKVVPKPRLGACEFTLEYRVDSPRLAADERADWTVPLITPVDGELTGNAFIAIPSPGMKVESRGGVWKPAVVESPATANQKALALAADRRADRVELTLQAEETDDSSVVNVEQAWLQTWLLGRSRLDRALFRFVSNRKEISLLVPPGIDSNRVSILLDGKRTIAAAAGSRLSIPLHDEGASRQHILEAQYEVGVDRAGPGRIGLELPQLGPNAWTKRTYWQVILPRNEHLLAAPANFTDENVWQWDGGLFGREPLLNDAALAAWIGVPPRESPHGGNCYLFGSFGGADRAELRTADRAWIVLTASGIVFVCGLLLLYVPFLRHPAVLLALGIALASAGLLHGETALLLAQAAGLGLGLIVLAYLLRSISPKRYKPAAAAEPSTKILIAQAKPEQAPAKAPGSDSAPTEPFVSMASKADENA